MDMLRRLISRRIIIIIIIIIIIKIISTPSSFFLRSTLYVIQNLSKIISAIFLWQVRQDLTLNFS